jgi:hypothetical protein
MLQTASNFWRRKSWRQTTKIKWHIAPGDATLFD